MNSENSGDARKGEAKGNQRLHASNVTEHRIEHEGSTLTRSELEEVDHRMKLRPLAVYEIVRQEGEDELTRPNRSLLWSGLAAGLSIGFSVWTQAALRAYLPDAPWRPLVECWGYAVGFLIVILGRQQLFTEITLTAVLPVLARTKLRGFIAIARLWAIVFFANMVGTAIFGYGIASDVLNTPDITAAALEVSRKAMEPDFHFMLLRGVAAGWLMATVVWLLPSADKSSFAVIALLTYLIALFHLAHVVAGSVEAFALVFAGEMTLAQAVFGFHIPALIGNVLGGAALFALISYGQVADELDERGN
ncbi:Formate/nitrite transporter FocA, FNT family [Fulvimarina manganoxydans]|uniref:Formate/nitrite transporter FocA, FNT family n=1 Tax=Fulvimarina manganoxydans TaxID=937218 RepID=A0A1W2AZQ0_9HYPH|nr:formate/nitrite transporter family protein [Fulvimarina manganoxydans]MEE2949982.1 formate/nitrite transporter family protein [Pseudomonadota bacterium]SMC65931.1 Formate/nitrite transporter FocA, FNT family [Fulvimarina manganoxydans]